MPAGTLTVLFSLLISISEGMFSKVIAVAEVSAMSLKQCALPRARTRADCEISSSISSSDVGAMLCASRKFTVPDQLALMR
jgi:hypothetical protein